MTEKKVMTIGELLAWAHEETKVADGLQRMMQTLPEELHSLIQVQINIRRERSRWLDHQVEYSLDAQDKEVNRE